MHSVNYFILFTFAHYIYVLIINFPFYFLLCAC